MGVQSGSPSGSSTDEKTAKEQERRIALRRALKSHPDDPRLKRAVQRLTTPQQIAAGAARGVFISYNRADEVFAFELYEALREASVAAWLDMVNADGDWQRAIDDALHRCGLMIAVLSPAALDAPGVTAERERFRAMGKLILPVMAVSCEVKRGHFWLPVIDLSTDFKRGMLTLRRALASGNSGV